MGSLSMQTEVCAAIRSLLASVPPYGAAPHRRADYQIRKAEVLDMVAVTDPYLSAQARELAVHARYEAQAIITAAHQY